MHTLDALIHSSIQSHLSQLLNTRQGSLLHVPDYGVPDLVSIYQGLPDSLGDLLNAITKTIEKYEPRLQYVHASVGQQSQQGCVLHIAITGQLRGGESQCFDSFLMCGGYVQVF